MDNVSPLSRHVKNFIGIFIPSCSHIFQQIVNWLPAKKRVFGLPDKAHAGTNQSCQKRYIPEHNDAVKSWTLSRTFHCARSFRMRVNSVEDVASLKNFFKREDRLVTAKFLRSSLHSLRFFMIVGRARRTFGHCVFRGDTNVPGRNLSERIRVYSYIQIIALLLQQVQLLWPRINQQDCRQVAKIGSNLSAICSFALMHHAYHRSAKIWIGLNDGDYEGTFKWEETGETLGTWNSWKAGHTGGGGAGKWSSCVADSLSAFSFNHATPHRKQKLQASRQRVWHQGINRRDVPFCKIIFQQRREHFVLNGPGFANVKLN